jgi:MerR family redox-sensitive transcriptional activator SoxR
MGDAVGGLSIGEVARRAEMAASRIRYYERRGLVPPPERRAGKRRYDARVLRRLAIIDAAQRVGSPRAMLPRTSGCDDSRCASSLRSRL